MSKKRYFVRGGNTYVVRKALFAGRPVYNARGEWVYAWYGKHIADDNKHDNWFLIGRTLDDVKAWASREEMKPAATK